MKRKLFWMLTALAGLSFASSNAQVLSYGAKLGMGFPGFVNEEIGSQRITLVTGLVGGLRITDGLQLMTELGYQRKGNKYTYQVWDPQGQVIEDSSYVVKTNLDYVTVPLFVRLNLGRSSKFYIQAGGYYGYLFHANFSGKLAGEMVKRHPIRSGLNPSDFGVIVGGGIETPIRPGLGVVLDVKYQYGLTDINRDPSVTGNALPLRNKGLSMSMGVYIDVE